MKAIVYTKFGPPDVLHPADIEKPLPKGNEILIRIHAASVNFGDTMARNFNAITPRKFNMPFLVWLISKPALGFNRPKITVLGNEYSGEVIAVGRDVKRFKPGDAVFGHRGSKFGAYAEFLCVPEDDLLAKKPDNMTNEEAAVVPYGAIMALPLLRRANLQPGQKVLINGASGAIGSAAVQIAKSLGAEVTGVCGTPRVECVKSLGADKVIDYTKEDFTKNGETYDLIFDILGKSSVSKCKSSLKPNGIHLFASFKLTQILQMLVTSKNHGKKVICAIAPGSVEDLIAVAELIEAGKLKVVIDRSYPLEQVGEAHRYYESGDKKGSVVIKVV